jgi:hypothetical protein
MACGGPARTPRETVELYLHSLVHDPIRTLPLVSSGFHGRHGLDFDDFRESHEGSELMARSARARREADAPKDSGDEALQLARARLGWLAALTRPVFRERGPLLAVRYLDEGIDGDQAQVEIQVKGPARAPIRASFHLVRLRADASWRIERIEVEERPGRLMAAYLIAPTGERWRRIEAIREDREQASKAQDR